MTAPLLDELNRDQDLAYRLLAKRDYVQASKLFEKLFEQGVRAVAVHLGFVFSRTENPACDREKAIHYYKVAAENNDAYAAYGLGALLAESGDRDGALKWFCEGSKLGYGACSFWAFRSLALAETLKLPTNSFFLKRWSSEILRPSKAIVAENEGAQFGIASMLPGVFEYIGNMPRMARFIGDNVSRPANMQQRRS